MELVHGLCFGIISIHRKVTNVGFTCRRSTGLQMRVQFTVKECQQLRCFGDLVVLISVAAHWYDSGCR